MSSNDNLQQDDAPSGSGRGDSGRLQTSNVIEFVNSEDPNVRSAIQRHTAYHSAAQRREARSRLLRRSSQARYLEWTRRPTTDTDIATSSASSASSVSISPAPSQRERSEHPTRPSSLERRSSSNTDQAVAEPASGTISPATQAGISADNTVLDFCKYNFRETRFKHETDQSIHGRSDTTNLAPTVTSTFCEHYQSRDFLESSIAYMLEHDTSRHLLLAYAYARRRAHPAADGNPQDQVDAERNLGRGTNILWNRLQMAGHASSDANVQAVLLLVAYAADFGQENEVRLHTDALRTMVDQRGGTDAFTDNPPLQHQLLVIGSSRRFHLTLDCEAGCAELLRFPDGLRLAQGANQSRMYT
ncbi:hypothetical protein A1O7_01485 [Cladophialophora yegresii CBS 114405]|uniref:Uncharacterized protein n=1 Tax=Cladophialophora yegresii CBS 114405 TaxID=1182544 RepID=W9WJJ1_9EURO|nr:uncharacterized protein A1O7_01485 [Cladophialophora yegresii CBS 114405]EXJ65145.1 hypothetical protein A1O7_01485 [Cladophialophora yegresii CBS 114405]